MTNTTAPESNKLSPARKAVLEALESLEGSGEIGTRKALAEATGVNLVNLKEHLDALLESGHIERPERGIYRIVNIQEARAVTCTALPDGRVKLEIGDNLIELTPPEQRMLGRMMAGFSFRTV